MRDFASFLEGLTSTSFKDVFMEIIQRKRARGELQTREEVLQEIDRLGRVALDTQAFRPVFTRREVGTQLLKIRSEEHFNLPMEEALLDINALYSYANRLDRVIKGHRRVHESDLARIEAGISKLSADIQGYLVGFGNETYTKFIYNGFTDVKNSAPAEQAAEIDTALNRLSLPVRRKRRPHEIKGTNAATAEVNVLTPVGQTASFATFGPNRAIDPDPNSFWASMFMTDVPVRTEYSSTDYSGVLVELIITLPYVESVNEIKFLPFAPFPVKIIDVAVWIDEDGWSSFNGFTSGDPTLRPMSWEGTPELAKKVKFVIQQESYKQVDFLLPEWLVNKQNLWIQVIDPETRLVLEDSDLYDRQKLQSGFNSEYNVYLEGLRRLIKETDFLEIEPYDGEEFNATKRMVDAVSRVMSPGDSEARRLTVKNLTGDEPEDDSANTVRMQACEYIVGAYNVEINHTEYFKEALYESPKYAAPGSVTEVVFGATETLPQEDNGWYPASTEYELEFAENRTAQVVPENISQVKDELVMIRPRTRNGTTRFPTSALASVAVRGNGRLLTSGTEYSASLLADNRVQIDIVERWYRKNTRYTVTYNLAGGDSHPSKVSLEDYIASSPVEEKFAETSDDAAIKLRHQPYVNSYIIHSTSFHKKDVGAVWELISATPEVIDGTYYGMLNSALSAAVSATINVIGLSNTTGLPAGAGTILIGDEIVTYGAVIGNNLIGCTRGASGTNASAHGALTPVIGRREYTPIVVTVNGVQAVNVTNYDTSEHPAFSQANTDTQIYEYVHLGDTLYFNKKIAAADIVIKYNCLAKYLKVNARLRANTIQRALYTPVVDDFVMKIRHTVL